MIGVLATLLLTQVSPPAPAPATAVAAPTSPATTPPYFRAKGAAAFVDGGKMKDGVSLFSVSCKGADCSLTIVTVNRCDRRTKGDERIEGQWPDAVVVNTRDGTLKVEALRPELGRFTMPDGNDRIVVEFVVDPVDRETRSMTATAHDKQGAHPFQAITPPLLQATCPFLVPGKAG